MENQQTNNIQKQKGKSIKSQPGSGSEYHREHASNVPDYGANNIDPNAVSLTNATDNTKNQ